MRVSKLVLSVFFNDTATTEIYTLSLHDALPISLRAGEPGPRCLSCLAAMGRRFPARRGGRCRARSRHERRSEEHTSELQSRQYLVCRLLLEKKKLLRRTPLCRRPLLHARVLRAR